MIYFPFSQYFSLPLDLMSDLTSRVLGGTIPGLKVSFRYTQKLAWSFVINLTVVHCRIEPLKSQKVVELNFPILLIVLLVHLHFSFENSFIFPEKKLNK